MTTDDGKTTEAFAVTPYVTNGISHPFHLDESTFTFKVIRSNFYAPNFEKVGSILLWA